MNLVSVYVSDQERSKKFFVEQLGFRLMIDMTFPSGYRWIEVAPPDGTARLALVGRAGIPRVAASHRTHLALAERLGAALGICRRLLLLGAWAAFGLRDAPQSV